MEIEGKVPEGKLLEAIDNCNHDPDCNLPKLPDPPTPKSPPGDSEDDDQDEADEPDVETHNINSETTHYREDEPILQTPQQAQTPEPAQPTPISSTNSVNPVNPVIKHQTANASVESNTALVWRVFWTDATDDKRKFLLVIIILVLFRICGFLW